MTAASRETARRNPNDKFAIYVSTLSGNEHTMIVSDPKREISHARVRPDGRRIVFSRFNIFNWRGEALEINGYNETEIVICKLATSDCRVVVAARKRIAAANAYWTPDGKKLLFVSNDTASANPGIKSLDLATGKVTAFYTPDDLAWPTPTRWVIKWW